MKIPAEFAPKSWEMPPGFVVLEDSASVVTREFDGEKLDWLVALVEVPTLEHPIVWIRPLDSKFDSGFVVLNSLKEIPVVITRQYALNAPLALVTTMFRKKRLGRQFYFNEQNQLCGENQVPKGALVVAASGFCSWFSGTAIGNWKDAVPFNYGISATSYEFLHLPALEIWKEIGNPKNETIEFARQFSLMDENERRKQMFHCERGAIEEIEEVFRTLLLSQSFWNEMPEGAGVQLHASAGKRGSSVSWFDSSLSRKEFQLSLKPEAAKIWQWFRPLNEDFSKKAAHLNWFKSNVPKIGLFVHPPSAHEQLEAKLRWRAWLASVE